jgi:hypothetical protein
LVAWQLERRAMSVDELLPGPFWTFHVLTRTLIGG